MKRVSSERLRTNGIWSRKARGMWVCLCCCCCKGKSCGGHRTPQVLVLEGLGTTQGFYLPTWATSPGWGSIRPSPECSKLCSKEYESEDQKSWKTIPIHGSPVDFPETISHTVWNLGPLFSWWPDLQVLLDSAHEVIFWFSCSSCSCPSLSPLCPAHSSPTPSSFSLTRSYCISDRLWTCDSGWVFQGLGLQTCHYTYLSHKAISWGNSLRVIWLNFTLCNVCFFLYKVHT